ncbi:Uncharacterized protein FWK35_00013827 [Aphis craccivora]|uniref:Ig-like domain-containing protein n=1 Tax=Aphis craccivora TaxID=307492 RepID=A0A6G0ZI95_APHCR|nr:Uncharacterized protein FWK35_00013827 [Aphis craccivora]
MSRCLHSDSCKYLTTVSWIRHRDIHLLTAGRYTYTSDQRFEAIHEPHSENWSLRIKYPQKKDSGIYECQISTTPPIGHPVYLTVLEQEHVFAPLLLLVPTSAFYELSRRRFGRHSAYCTVTAIGFQELG